jgi:hypothetical protein
MSWYAAEGIAFGATFSGLFEAMWSASYETDRSPDIAAFEKADIEVTTYAKVPLEIAEGVTVGLVAPFVETYFPEHVETLKLRGNTANA